MNLITEQTLEDLEKTQKEFWNISRQSANFLSMIIKISNSKKGLEIGTSNGYSGIWLANALKNNNGLLTTIEYWEKRLCIARENFKKCSVDKNIKILQGSALDILEDLQTKNEEFDFVFIDANKTEYIKYFEIIDKMLKSGGIITADNILSHEAKTKDFVEKIYADERYQSQILDLP